MNMKSVKKEHLDDLLTFLSFASISTDSANKGDVDACADWLGAKLSGMGLDVDKHFTAGHPIVVARNAHLKGRPTVMIYGHYDVQPVDPLELWKTPPFEPTIIDDVIFARGATDNKGQLMAHVIGMQETILTEGHLPVNVILLFEGEEEIGSPNLEPFLREHREALKCDVVAVSDTGMVARGVPTFTYGLRGIACMEVKVTGPSVDLHSGIYGGAVANPAAVVARLAASLHDADERIAIEGFYDAVAPLEEWERTAWQKLPDGDADTLAQTGVPALNGEAGYSSYERRWARPTAEVNGIGGGYQGEGSKTVIPKEAMLKLSFRLVPGQKPEEVLDLAAKHLEAVCPAGVELTIERGHSGEAYLMDAHSDYGKAAQEALRDTFEGREPALIREGGSIPIVQSFQDILGVDTMLLGLGLPDCNAHAPNENFSIENFGAGIQLNGHLLRRLAAV
jgi:acetylornithine deacetylase/succinyl-diaminopimelate desuccinylase-like protein